MQAHNLAGKRFGKLVAKTYIPKRGWECVCDCGVTKILETRYLTRGSSKSCGCGSNRTKWKARGARHERLYQIWYGMKTRCCNPKSPMYKWYGAKGVAVYERWLTSYDNFKEDMSPDPGRGWSIDRIDPRGDYCPENCRWLLRSEQPDNRRNARRIEHQGKMWSIKELAREYGLEYDDLYSRLADADFMVAANTLLPPDEYRVRRQATRGNRFLTHDGETHCLAEWARRLGIRVGTLRQRLRRGESVAEALRPSEYAAKNGLCDPKYVKNARDSNRGRKSERVKPVESSIAQVDRASSPT